MNIGLIGGGGREHAICQKLFESNLCKKIFCLPGNAGTSKIAHNLEIDILNFRKVLSTIHKNKIDIVVVGPEEPLVKGLVNFLEKNNIKVFGPNKFASKLEGSKAFMKKFCKQNNIPTAKYQICKNKSQFSKFLKQFKFPVVIKADGLAAGKGVTICNDRKKAFTISNEIFKGKFKSSKKLVLEEFLEGEEASYFVIVDKKTFKFFGSAQDHKRVGEKDEGPNTGGMGAYSPAPIITKKIEKKIISKIIKPTLRALIRKRSPYKGILYVGLMIKNNEPNLIEFNVRMGDPECQVILPRLKSDFVKIIQNTIENKLSSSKINWKKKKSMTIVLCSKGYPANYKKNRRIDNITKIKNKKDVLIFHAGTKLLKNRIVSNGGRVLNITSLGNSFLLIRKKIIKTLKKINWQHGFYRKDIGWKVINKNENHKR